MTKTATKKANKVAKKKATVEPVVQYFHEVQSSLDELSGMMGAYMRMQAMRSAGAAEYKRRQEEEKKKEAPVVVEGEEDKKEAVVVSLTQEN